jgi:surface antigen
MRAIGKLACVALLALGLEGCAGPMVEYDETPPPAPVERGQVTVENDNQKPLQCVPYAREHSRIKLFGDAYTWWNKAAGKYPRTSHPEQGAVLVLHNYAGASRAHVAVVRELVGTREIRVDHANWLNDGSIYENDPVEDVSSANDWSVVRVFNLRTGAWGSRLYPVQGFIGSGSTDSVPVDQSRPPLVARNGGSGRGATALVGEIY